MKIEYKTKSTELLSGIDSKINKILEMLEGKRPADTADAISMCKSIKRNIETTQNLIDNS